MIFRNEENVGVSIELYAVTYICIYSSSKPYHKCHANSGVTDTDLPVRI